jgi:hypothetical protein
MATRGVKVNVFIRKIEIRWQLCKELECEYGIDDHSVKIAM